MDSKELFYYNSRDTRCKSEFGAVKSGKRIDYSFYAKYGVYVDRVYLVIQRDGEDNVWHRLDFVANSGGYTQFSTHLSYNTGLYWYYFEVHTELGVFELRKGAKGVATENSGIPYQLTVYDREYKTPRANKGGLIYHIFVDRFNRGDDEGVVFDKVDAHLKEWNEPVTVVDSDGVYRANDFYGGNFQGIIDKLDYLKSLGVTLLYLSPIFESASNHRYDTGDYMHVDKLLGTEAKFRELVTKAKAKGIGIMLDGVFNHTGADSIYFNKFGHYDSVGAYNSPDSPYHDWYYFTDFPDKYGCWWGCTCVPTVNKTNLDYRRYIFGDGGVLEKWLHCGIAGWRLDVVDELDVPFVDNIRKKVKDTDPEAVIIGEVWEDASNKISYSERRPYLLGCQLDGVMNYPFKDAIMGYVMSGHKDIFREIVMNIVENYPKASLDSSMTFIDTHDTVRAINIFSEKNVRDTSKVERSRITLEGEELRRGATKLMLASVIQYTLPGIPSIYYGDEVGLDGFEDPINRRPFPWNHINEKLLSHFRMLGKIRAKNKRVFEGFIEFQDHDSLLIYDRISSKKRIRVVLNATCDTTTYDVEGMDLVHGEHVTSVTLQPYGFALIEIQSGMTHPLIMS